VLLAWVGAVVVISLFTNFSLSTFIFMFHR
jgi:hypothetical protein